MNNRNQGQQGDPREPAHAPYNFIPLPERIIDVRDQFGSRDSIRIEDALPPHNVYRSDRHHGYFQVALTAETPLYIRGTLTRQQAEKMQAGTDEEKRAIKNEPAFFHVGDETAPRIPGSSLRGMLRSLVEIVGFGKLDRMSEKKLFFRTVDDTSVGKQYSKRMTGKVETGFLRPSSDPDYPYTIYLCDMVQIHRDNLNMLYEGRRPNLAPRWSGENWHQYQRVWIKGVTGSKFADEITDTNPNAGGYEEGILVITGDMPEKKHEFVFLLRGAGAATVRVPEAMIDRFHDDDQITQWQEKAFPAEKPQKGSRRRDGMLQINAALPGEPVFFLREQNQQGVDELTFFGRAGMFRLPYLNSPTSLLDKQNSALRDPNVYDFAESLFGFIRPKGQAPHIDSHPQGHPARAYAGRVSITDATLNLDQPFLENPTDLYEPEITPPILSTPKPTTFQHYLMQDKGVNTPKAKLHHYDSAGVKLRGHKLYWRRKRERALDIPGATTAPPPPTDTQHTRIRPLRRGVQFTFQVYFENLTDVELGLLAWALVLPDSDNHRHMLGMGKPFGLGVVKCEPTLYLCDRAARYGALFEGESWATGYRKEGAAQFISAFEAFVVQQVGSNSFADIDRIKQLKVMLNWYEDNPQLFSYMQIEPQNEYKNRPVLPSPNFVKAKYDKAQNQAHGIQKDIVVRGVVVADSDNDEEDVEFKLKRSPDNRTYVGYILAEHRRETPYTENQDVSAFVLKVEEGSDGVIYLLCRHATKEERKGKA